MGGTAAAFVAAFAVSTALGRPLITLLRTVGVKQTVSADAPVTHATKQGTPTMGGLLILAGLAVPVAVEGVLHRRGQAAFVLLGLTLAFGLIGFLDDFLIATHGRNLGLRAREKFTLQVVFATAFVLWLRATAVPGQTMLAVAGGADLGTAYYVLGVLLIVGMSNAVNFADGLDGLAGGVCAIIAVAMAGTVYAAQGHEWLPLFGGALAGACAGFLWFNAHPAQVFMGDTGSLALGAALSGMAILGKAEGTFQVYAIIPWAALFSVMIQVPVYKYRKRRYGEEYAKTHRVFRRTPIHHHFEEIGWKETKIVQRFWLVTALAVAVMLALGAGR